uniref:ABC transporter domain-containing protein n=1 Tax=Calcidiscus leptoporus TaxID=127549 RepID=A0A6U5H1T4_9EUKA
MCCAGADGTPHAGLLGVLGPSGSGKSTLLTLLAGHAPPPPGGTIELNGHTLEKSTAARIGFVPQTDSLFPFLTVRETLEIGGRLRGLSATVAFERASAALEQMRLSAVEHCRVGEASLLPQRGISGGERKRLSLALETVRDVDALVLDEPSSGLDAHSTLELLRALAAIASSRAVLCSLHQPSAKAWAQVSQTLLLDARGRTIYFGASKDANRHFDACGHPMPPLCNAAEHFLDLALEETPLPAPKPVLPRMVMLPLTPLHQPPFLALLGTLFGRASKQNCRNPAFLRVLLSRSATMAPVIAWLFSQAHVLTQRGVQDRTGALFFLLTTQIMSSSSSMRTFLSERAIVEHEQRASLYGVLPYFLARSFAESYLHLGAASLFALLCHLLLGLASPLGAFVAVVALVTLVAESYVIALGSLLTNEKVAAVISSLLLALQMAAGGFFANSASAAPVQRALNTVNMYKYGFAALVQLEFDGLRFDCTPAELIGSLPPARWQRRLLSVMRVTVAEQRCPVVSGEQVVEQLHLDDMTATQNVLALGLLVVGYRFVAYLALRRRFRSPLC